MNAHSKTPPPASAPINWLFIDVGGVLFDDEPLLDALYSYFGDALRTRGVSVTQEELQAKRTAMIERGESGIYKALLSHYASGEEMYREILSEFRSWLKPRQAELNPLRAKVPEALGTLASRFKLAVAANQGAYLDELLRQRGIAHYFSSITVSGEIGVAKPDPEFFQQMLDRAGCSPDAAVMIGDSLANDLQPAHAFGLRTVRVIAGGDNIRDDSRYDFVTGVVRALDELPTLLSEWSDGQ